MTKKILVDPFELLQRYDSGETLQKIADSLGVTREGVRLCLKSTGQYERLSFRRLTTEEKARNRERQFELKFWSRVKKGGPDDCWEWMGSRLPKSQYGTLSFHGKRNYAHRVAWILTNGPVPEDKPHICHTCDWPPCANPKHLFAGTVADNMHDRDAKGRGKYGKNAPHKEKSK